MELCRILVLSSVLVSGHLVSDFSEDLKEPNVTYYLVTRRDNETVFSRVYSYPDLTSEGYPEKLYVLFHGFGGAANASSTLLLANALLDHGEKNILAVDYEAAVALPYDKAVNRSLPVGEKVAEFLSVSSFPLKFVGYSLGAHIAGITGHILKERNDILVDSIIVDILVELVCSHNAAVEYLSESVGGGFPATKCSSWYDFKNDLCANWQTVRLGFDLSSDVRGMFFLKTQRDPPYGDPLDCSHDMKRMYARSCSTRKEETKDSPATLLLVLVAQCISIWLIYRYYPF